MIVVYVHDIHRKTHNTVTLSYLTFSSILEATRNLINGLLQTEERNFSRLHKNFHFIIVRSSPNRTQVFNILLAVVQT
jgi:hypothetical protein